MSNITPDDVARREFRTSFRGYDPEEVRSFLAAISEGLQELVAERDQLLAQSGTVSEADLKAEFEQIGREVSAVLEQARQAAESMRERAAADATRWRSEAVAESESELRRARADAEQLRSDSWSTSEEMLAQAQREAAHLIDEAKAEALRVMGETERESHKVASGTRRDADDVLRNARMEAERLVVDAQARHDEIIETAHRQAETAQERTRALEQRRDELKKELDTVRLALSSVETETDERREQLGLSSTGPDIAEAASVTAPEDESGEHWALGETVRVVRPEPGSVPPIEPGTVSGARPLEDAPEIRVISAEELRGLRSDPAEEPEAPSPQVDLASAFLGEVPETSDGPAEVVELEPGPPVATPVTESDQPVRLEPVEPDQSERVEPVRSQPVEPMIVVGETPVPEAPVEDHVAEGQDAEIEVSEPVASEEPGAADDRAEVSPTEPAGAPTVTEPEPAEASPPTVAEEPARQQSFDELVGLFDRLRHEPGAVDDRAETSPSQPALDPASQPATEPVLEPDPAETMEMTEMVEPADAALEATPSPPMRPVRGVDPFEIRDQLLLPVSNRALRNLKRQLAEEGNVSLEELHLEPDAWTPDTDEVVSKIRADLVVLHAESFGAGHGAAELLTGERMTRPPTPRIDVVSTFASDLVSDVEHALGEGRLAGQGALQLKATVARVFRAWRTDESERRMRALSVAAFNAGLAETLRMNEIDDVVWVVSGRGCADCRSMTEGSLGDRLPPAHDGCECTVMPG